MKRRLIATLLVLGLMMSFVPMTLFTAGATEWYDDSKTELEVTNADELIAFANQIKNGNAFAGKTIHIMADIDLGARGIDPSQPGGASQPEGSDAGTAWPLSYSGYNTFSGMIDGHGHTIKGINVSYGNNSQRALFGAYLQPVQNFTVGVRNLTITDSFVRGKNQSAGLFANINNGADDTAKVAFENLVLDIDVWANALTKNSLDNDAAGVIASVSEASNVLVRNVVSKGQIYGVGENTAGLIGIVTGKTTIDNTVVEGLIKSDVTDTNNYGNTPIGGFVAQLGIKKDGAQATGALTVTNSAFYGTLQLTYTGKITKFAGILANTLGSNNADQVYIENVIVDGVLDAAASSANILTYNRGTVLGVGASGSTVTIKNAVGSLVYNGAAQTSWPIGSKGVTNSPSCEIPDDIKSPSFTGKANGSGSNVTVNLGSTFMVSKAQKKVLPNGAFLLYDQTISVSTADELVAIAQDIADGEKYTATTILLEDNIDLTGETWPLIGKHTTVFSGMIDGQGYTLSGVQWGTATISYQGLFGSNIKAVFEGFEAGVKNLSVTDVSVSGKGYTDSSKFWGEGSTGGLFGRIDETTAGKVVFENLDLTIAVSNAASRTGGLVGESRADDVTISNTIFRGTVSGTSEVGGLIGWQLDVKMNVYNTAVTGSITASGANSGGFFGHVRELYEDDNSVTTITQCVFDGTLTTNATAEAYAGGFVGTVGNDATRGGKLIIQDSTFKGKVHTGKATDPTHIGGLVGSTKGTCSPNVTLNRCVVAGEMTAPDDLSIGNSKHIRMTIAVVAGGGSANINNIVGHATGNLIEQAYNERNEQGIDISSTPADSGTKNWFINDANEKKVILNGPSGMISNSLEFVSSNDETVKVDLTDTFVATTSTCPLPKGAVQFYAEGMRKVDAGSVTYAAVYQDFVENDMYTVRLVGLLKDIGDKDGAGKYTAYYEKVGLEVVAIRKDGTEVKSIDGIGAEGTGDIYTALYAGGEEVSAPKIVDGAENYKYAFTGLLYDIPVNSGVLTLVVRSFHEVGGERIYDDTSVFNIDTAVEAVA